MTNAKKIVIKCPHCDVTYDQIATMTDKARQFVDKRGTWFVVATKCPSCENFRITIDLHELETGSHFTTLSNAEGIARSGNKLGKMLYQRVVYPFPAVGKMIEDIPEYLHEDYKDAIANLDISPRLSAACSRRCLQTLIRRHYKIHEKTLYQEIEKLSKLRTLSSEVIKLLEMVRDYGNLGAHPTFRRDEDGEITGEIVNVEPGEAQDTLYLLEALFDEVFLKAKKLVEIQERHARKKSEVTKAEEAVQKAKSKK
jgi:hypothetical protein